MSRMDAAKQASVHHRTLLAWLKKGEVAKSGEYFDFYYRMMKAESEAKRIWIQKVQDGWSEPSVKQILKDGQVVAEHKEIKQKKIDPLRWLALKYPHEFGQHAVKELQDEEIIDRFFGVIEERHGKDFAGEHRVLYNRGLAKEDLESDVDSPEAKQTYEWLRKRYREALVKGDPLEVARLSAQVLSWERFFTTGNFVDEGLDDQEIASVDKAERELAAMLRGKP